MAVMLTERNVFAAVYLSSEILSALCHDELIFPRFFLFLNFIALSLFYTSRLWVMKLIFFEYCDRSYDYVFIVVSISSVREKNIVMSVRMNGDDGD